VACWTRARPSTLSPSPEHGQLLHQPPSRRCTGAGRADLDAIEQLLTVHPPQRRVQQIHRSPADPAQHQCRRSSPSPPSPDRRGGSVVRRHRRPVFLRSANRKGAGVSRPGREAARGGAVGFTGRSPRMPGGNLWCSSDRTLYSSTAPQGASPGACRCSLGAPPGFGGRTPGAALSTHGRKSLWSRGRLVSCPLRPTLRALRGSYYDAWASGRHANVSPDDPPTDHAVSFSGWCTRDDLLKFERARSRSRPSPERKGCPGDSDHAGLLQDGRGTLLETPPRLARFTPPQPARWCESMPPTPAGGPVRSLLQFPDAQGPDVLPAAWAA